MTDEERRQVDSRYVLSESFRDHCDSCKEANESKRKIIVDSAMKRFERIEKDLEDCEGVVADYKKTINGKFDKIMYSIIGMLVLLVGTLASTVWIQQTAKTDIDSKFKTIIEGRAYHQGISEENNNEFTIVLRRLGEIEGRLVDHKRKHGKEINP